MTFEITEPILVIGLGRVGAKLAEKAKKSLNSDSLVISHDQKDLTGKNSIKISTKSVVNPSIHLIRGSTLENLEEIEKNLVRLRQVTNQKPYLTFIAKFNNQVVQYTHII